jgi:hypothetical protein
MHRVSDSSEGLEMGGGEVIGEDSTSFWVLLVMILVLAIVTGAHIGLIESRVSALEQTVKAAK